MRENILYIIVENILWRDKRKEEESQAVCFINKPKLIDLIFFGMWPEKMNSLGNSQSSLDARGQEITQATAAI